MDKTDVLNKPGLFINSNVMQIDDSVIQISNISKTQIGPIPRGSFPSWTIIVMVLSLLIMVMKISEVTSVVGLLGLVASVLVLFGYYNGSEGYYLIVWLNSGNCICISSDDQNFLKVAQQTITDCFDGLFDKNSSYIVNFKDCTITKSQIGRNNTSIH